MARYSVSGVQTGSGTGVADSCLDITVNASTAHRIWVEEIFVGMGGSPADNVILWLVQRITAPGTGGAAVTPVPLDPQDRAAQGVANEEITTQGNATANQELLQLLLNQRASFRWVAAPGSELVTPATTTDGFTIAATSSGVTVQSRAQAIFRE
jgi:hypothetical protein